MGLILNLEILYYLHADQKDLRRSKATTQGIKVVLYGPSAFSID